MNPFTRALAAVLFATLGIAASGGTGATNRASRPLTAQEMETFLPLVCARPHKSSDRDNHCSKLNGYPSEGDVAFALTAILYGSFTRAGSDEAYATFFSPNFSHADNFGGGVLFAHANGSWKLARWFPGWLMDRCTGIPQTAPQLNLCATGFTGQGETTSSVWVWRVPLSGGSLIPVGDALLRADDTSGVSQEAENGCYSGVPRGRAHLTAIESIEPSSVAPYFAVAKVSYETGEDIASACNGAHPRKVRTTQGQVHFREVAGKVTAVTPLPFVTVP